jgi:hypothetical protein
LADIEDVNLRYLKNVVNEVIIEDERENNGMSNSNSNNKRKQFEKDNQNFEITPKKNKIVKKHKKPKDKDLKVFKIIRPDQKTLTYSDLEL